MNEETTAPQQPAYNPTESYPIQVQMAYPEKSSRLLALLTILFFLKAILLIPHLVVMYFLSLFSLIAMFVAQLVVLVKGVFPPKLFALLRATYAWQMRVNGYMLGMTDQYPPLAFDQKDSADAMTAIKRILLGIVIFIAIIIVLMVLVNR